MLPTDAPFVLLDDAREGGAQTLYRDPVEIVSARTPEEVRAALARLRGALDEGHHAAGWIGYEAGHALDAKLTPLAISSEPDAPWLLWFGLFERAETLPAGALEAMLPDPAGGWAGQPRPLITRADYEVALDRTKTLIAAGDIYQANLSFRATVATMGSPLALYARMRAQSGAGWGGIVHDGRHWLLSLSPELFFRIEGSRIAARPMKGTAPRGRTPAEDDAYAARLAADPKERAENLMIVDLLRNDISRVARAGSVVVPELFAVERYPTIQQMVSEVEAELAPGRDAIDVIEALFPCGSITGAPKIRAMEIIDAVEADARGPYTGAIGHLGPDGSAVFNVAIRTLVLEEGADEARIGLGSAVVADSTADGEWRECLAKGAFVTAGQRPFDLIETMRFDPLDGIVELERHIARLGRSARAFGFRFDRHEVRNELHAATFRLLDASRVRLLLSPSGAISIEARPMPPEPATPVAVRIVPLPVDPADFRLKHKTTARAFYDEARHAAGSFEILFERPDGFLTEGSFTNLFVPREGQLLTPPLARGLLPGILRETLLASGEAIEGDLTASDLRDGFYIGNALRGLIAARLI
ncbi:aminodeoxychorismate synthase component I [Sphingomonas sp. MMS24-J13]|uniref:aminodeoxychorismate synthase component I n=1 Tax=Sphingomonas sp. MMS24-J13 TaxID=3238686 RepID=UPI00384E6206